MGTLFLDEIADLSPAVQVKLLRVVEERAVRPVGGSEPVQVDVRLLSATWASLPDRVAEGRFREDLLHRVATLVIEVPPLRDRQSDIAALATTLLARLESDVGKKELTSSAMALLVAYPWPGNVRELSSVLCRAAVLGAAQRIEARHVQHALPKLRRTSGCAVGRRQASDLLAEHGGNQSAAARAAGVPRSTFRSWLAADVRTGRPE
jgi:DNA-binding NtrC family response regulator